MSKEKIKHKLIYLRLIFLTELIENYFMIPLIKLENDKYEIARYFKTIYYR